MKIKVWYDNSDPSDITPVISFGKSNGESNEAFIEAAHPKEMDNDFYEVDKSGVPFYQRKSKSVVDQIIADRAQVTVQAELDEAQKAQDIIDIKSKLAGATTIAELKTALATLSDLLSWLAKK